MKKFLKYMTLLTTMLTVFVLVACGGGDDKKDEPLIETSIQFSWVHTIEFAGFYEAVEKGFYTEQGLNVRLDSGGFDADGNYIFPPVPVLNGDADFGVAGGDVLLSARASGSPLVAIAAIYQRNPVVLVSLAENGIRLPEDLVGKNIGIDGPGTATDIVYKAFMASQGIDASEVTEIIQPLNLDPLTNGEIDVRTGFVTNQPVALGAMGLDVEIILPSDYGIDLYSNVIFTTEDIIANQPELVEKFLRATIQGYDAAIEDPGHAAELSVARNPDLALETELASMNFSLPLIKPAGRDTGMMEQGAWDMTHQVMLNQGMLNAAIDYNAAFTLEFLNTIHD